MKGIAWVVIGIVSFVIILAIIACACKRNARAQTRQTVIAYPNAQYPANAGTAYPSVTYTNQPASNIHYNQPAPQTLYNQPPPLYSEAVKYSNQPPTNFSNNDQKF